MINFLIFSKDRACQLDLLLRSIKEYCQVSLYQVNILYTYSKEHETSYKICKSRHPKCNWIKEDCFCKQSKELLIGKVCLLTDDTVFFRHFSEVLSLGENEIFSWRLGYNTFIQDHVTARKQPQLIPDAETEKYIWWNPNNYPEWCNYGYPFSFDGHLYPEGMLLDILKDKDFKSTNEMEGILHSHRSRITRLVSNFHSSCVNVPVNNLSGLTQSGTKYSYSLDRLRDFFVSGKKILLVKNKNKTPIIGCHQELEFEFYE